jgi:hypothetical protein
MRSFSTGAAVTITLLAAACSEHPASSPVAADELKRDLAAASVSSGALATPPAKFERLNFVSGIEASRATVKAPRPKPAPHHEHMIADRKDGPESNTGVAEEAVAVAVVSPAASTVTEVATPAEDTYIDERATMRTGAGGPSAAPSGERGHGSGRGIGAVIGNIIGGVVIRGGYGDDDKCDPRSDGRRAGRGTFSMPAPVGGMRYGRFVYR